MALREEMKLGKTAKNQWGAAQYLSENGKTDCAYLNNIYPNGVAALEKKGYVIVTREQRLRDPYKTVAAEKVDRTLTLDQQRAVDTVCNDSRTVQLLHGVTGSGKTEVYLTLIAKCLEEGKSSIFLNVSDKSSVTTGSRESSVALT